MDSDKEATPLSWPSVGDVAPIEEGGPEARKGFNYQDEIAAGFLITMLENASLLRVHCETHDDLVLLWSKQDEEEAEYVQVKGSEQDQLWSLSKLCQKKTKNSDSIFEASLGRDRHKESSNFRIITIRQVNNDLVPLTYTCSSEGRTLASEKIKVVYTYLETKFPKLTSPKGNDCRFWVDHCYWDVRNDLVTAHNDNLRRLFALCNAAGIPLLLEQLEGLLDELRAWVKAAGDAKWIPDRAKKIISRADVCDWWARRLGELQATHVVSAGGQLAAKMRAVNLPEDMVSLALELRRDYATEVRSPRYMEPDRMYQLQRQVKSEVMSLRAEFMAGELQLSGQAFHAACLKRMTEIAPSSDGNDIAVFLKGCLYDITDRCLLRFERPTP